MKKEIVEHLDNAAELESLYRRDKKVFKQSFKDLYPEIAGSQLTAFWKARFDADDLKEEGLKFKGAHVFYLLLACAISGFLVKLPLILGMDGTGEMMFFQKNVGLIVFFGLSLFVFLTRETLHVRGLIATALVFALSTIYINWMPADAASDTATLAYIHLPLLLWCVYGWVFINFDTKNRLKPIEFIRYNGDAVVLGAIILIAGGALTGITMGLFYAIGIQIENFYMEYVAMIGLVSAPIVSTYIVRNYPSITNKIAPVIAQIFSPLVLITLVIFLISILISGKDPFNDREFLLIFNMMLLGVMAIIVFSITGAAGNKKQRFNEMTIWILSVITLIIDLVALSAIIYRLGEFGFTPNRTAVLGSNLLIFVHLLLLMIDLYKVNFKNKALNSTERTIAVYLPVYALWTLVVVVVFPLIFGYK